jgi:hypothetical protein
MTNYYVLGEIFTYPSMKHNILYQLKYTLYPLQSPHDPKQSTCLQTQINVSKRLIYECNFKAITYLHRHQKQTHRWHKLFL